MQARGQTAYFSLALTALDAGPLAAVPVRVELNRHIAAVYAKAANPDDQYQAFDLIEDVVHLHSEGMMERDAAAQLLLLVAAGKNEQ